MYRAIIMNKCKMERVSIKLSKVVEKKIKIRKFFSKIKLCKELKGVELSEYIFDLVDERYPRIKASDRKDLIKLIDNQVK
jgi:hypothetical protein